MATLETPPSSAFEAASRALDHAISTAVEHAPSHASGTTFIPADLVGSGRFREYRRLGPVSIIDSNGNETRLSQDRTIEFWIATIAIGAIVWALARRG